MTVYWITFRISEDRVGGRTYEERYEALNIEILNAASEWWSEPTSYYAFSSSQSIDKISAACKRAIAPTHDLFLIREMDTKSARICGKNDDQTIFRLMPYLKAI